MESKFKLTECFNLFVDFFAGYQNVKIERERWSDFKYVPFRKIFKPFTAICCFPIQIGLFVEEPTLTRTTKLFEDCGKIGL